MGKARMVVSNELLARALGIEHFKILGAYQDYRESNAINIVLESDEFDEDDGEFWSLPKIVVTISNENGHKKTEWIYA